MFKFAIVYRIAPGWEPPPLARLEEALDRARYLPCGPTEPRSAGWIAPRGGEHEALAESVGGQWILCLRTETRAVPGAAIRDALEARLQRIEHETGSRPRGKRRKELKEEVVVDLLPRAFSKHAVTRIWIDPKARLMVVGAGSSARADEAVGALMEALRGIDAVLPASLLKTKLSPSTAMSAWLAEREAPAGFSVDRECELKQAGAGESQLAVEGAAVERADEKATVRYSRHSLDIDEIRAHIAQGKVATKLAMTWQDRVSFLLDSSMSLKRIEILDVVLEGAAEAGQDGADDDFDAGAAIATGELGRLIPDLVEALGGEIEPEDCGLAAAAPAPAAQVAIA